MNPRSRFKHGAVRRWVIYLILLFLAILFYSPSSRPETAEYDIFLSFSGVDVRHKFVSHLHAALLQKSIKVFIDDDLGRGESMEPVLLNAIFNSKLAIIVFSKNYASSTYCLEELFQIIQCHAPRRTAFPIFYEVNPSDVVYQSGVFAEALAVHEEVLKHSEKVFQWRLALTTAANMAGWVSENEKPEAELIREVVNHISRRLALHTSHIVWEKTRQVAACCLSFALPVVIFMWPADDDQSPEKPKHVFMNYYGVGHLASALYDVLDEKGHQTFKDEGFARRTEFTEDVKDAIMRSNVAVIIFSKFCTRSPRFLDALVMIMECYDHGQIEVIPVYFEVDPSDRSQWESFEMYEQQPGCKDKVKAWKDAAERVHMLTTGDGKQGRRETIINDLARDVAGKVGRL